MTDTKVMSNEVNEVVESAEVVTTTAKKKRSPLARVGAICAVVAACACIALPVSATGDESSTPATNNQIAETMSQSFTTVASDLGGYAQTVLPAGLAVFAITFCVRKGMGFFRTVAH